MLRNVATTMTVNVQTLPPLINAAMDTAQAGKLRISTSGIGKRRVSGFDNIIGILGFVTIKVIKISTRGISAITFRGNSSDGWEDATTKTPRGKLAHKHKQWKGFGAASGKSGRQPCHRLKTRDACRWLFCCVQCASARTEVRDPP